MFPKCELSARQCAQLRAKIAAWPDCSLSRKIFPTRSLCLRLSSSEPNTFAFSCSNFIVNLTQLKWYVLHVLTSYQMLNVVQFCGWVKYRYSEANKSNFATAKKATLLYLDMCPTGIIHRFINCSWRFMNTYRKGLTGKATAWAVHKHKQHCAVSQSAMMALEAILN